MNDDLISRAALLAAYDAAHKGPPGGARKLIEEAPGVDAAPERQGYVRVTRCRDCKRWEYDLDLATIGKGTCLNSLLWTKPNDYCSRGERTDSHTCGPDYCELEADHD